MMNSIKRSILALLLLPLLLTGCDDWFDTGDTEKAYDGPDVIAFADLESTVDEGDTESVDIQFISSNGLAQSDISVSVSVAGSSTAPSSTYSLSSTSLTISAGSAATTLTVTFPTNPDISDGDEVRLDLTISSSDVEASENLDTTTFFINGAG